MLYSTTYSPPFKTEAIAVTRLWCAHEIDNLYVVDGSFMPSIGAVNPTLTIIANAIRVSDHIASRLS